MKMRPTEWLIGELGVRFPCFLNKTTPSKEMTILPTGAMRQLA
jgi:hypothetical protein